jgi:hypothetical protein
MNILSKFQKEKPVQTEGMWTIKKDSEILAGLPKEYPTELVA